MVHSLPSPHEFRDRGASTAVKDVVGSTCSVSFLFGFAFGIPAQTRGSEPAPMSFSLAIRRQNNI